MDTIYKDRQGGAWVYWIYSKDECRNYYISEQTALKLLRRKGYRLVELER